VRGLVAAIAALNLVSLIMLSPFVPLSLQLLYSLLVGSKRIPVAIFTFLPELAHITLKLNSFRIQLCIFLLIFNP
jgi:hypothetical protein